MSCYFGFRGWYNTVAWTAWVLLVVAGCSCFAAWGVVERQCLEELSGCTDSPIVSRPASPTMERLKLADLRLPQNTSDWVCSEFFLPDAFDACSDCYPSSDACNSPYLQLLLAGACLLGLAALPFLFCCCCSAPPPRAAAADYTYF